MCSHVIVSFDLNALHRMEELFIIVILFHILLLKVICGGQSMAKAITNITCKLKLVGLCSNSD